MFSTIQSHAGRRHSVNDILFFMGWLLLIPFTILALFYNIGWIHPTHWLPPCLFHFVTGLPCPGCGGTRAFVSLLKGDLIHSFLYHPVVPFCFLLYVIFMMTQTMERILRRKTNLRFHALSFRLEYAHFGAMDRQNNSGPPMRAAIFVINMSYTMKCRRGKTAASTALLRFHCLDQCY